MIVIFCMLVLVSIAFCRGVQSTSTSGLRLPFVRRSISRKKVPVSPFLSILKSYVSSDIENREANGLHDQYIESVKISDNNTTSYCFGNVSTHGEAQSDLVQQFRGKVLHIKLPEHPYCEIFVCGTLHVSSSSTQMVKTVIQQIKPNIVIVELCGNRVDSLMVEDNQPDQPVTLRDIFRAAWIDKSILTLGTGMLVWMQGKAASLLGNKLGGELVAAAKEAHKIGATLVLGDRLYDVTIQRIFDRLGFLEKLKAAVLMIWEVITMSMNKMKEYIAKSDESEDFVIDEIEKFAKYFPALADVIIRERDEYLAQSVLEVVRCVTPVRMEKIHANKIVVVVGAGHLNGILHHLENGGVNGSRILEISKSSKHPSTWPQRGYFPTVDLEVIFGSRQQFDFKHFAAGSLAE